jgi:hypothetical protein
MTKGWKALVKWEFQIINANDSSVSTSHSGEYIYETLGGCGAINLLTNETMRAYLKDGKVTFRAKVSVQMPDDLASAPLLTSAPILLALRIQSRMMPHDAATVAKNSNNSNTHSFSVSISISLSPLFNLILSPFLS